MKVGADNHKFKQLLFVLDRSKPEIIRFDVVKKSRIKISVLFTADGKTPFPALSQFVFVRGINRMFVVGGSNHLSNKVEKWNVIQVRLTGLHRFRASKPMEPTLENYCLVLHLLDGRFTQINGKLSESSICFVQDMHILELILIIAIFTVLEAKMKEQLV